MESDSASHSIPSPSETQNTIDTSTNDDGSSRKREIEVSTSKPPVAPKKKSPYWEHCEKGTRKTSDGSLQKIGICNYCKAEVPASYGSTSGLKNHLLKRCKSSPIYEVSGSEKGQTILTNETMGQGSHVVSHTFNQKRCELKLTEFVIIDEASLRAIEERGFVGLLHELQPRFRIPDRKKVADANVNQDCSQAISPASTLSAT